jgi:hypothetical protein
MHAQTGRPGARTDYFVTNTIRNCDFLVSVPVMKIHEQCGITASLKNYVGTAPRQAYAPPNGFWNAQLHAQHSLEGRIDSFITDLASFHPPDFCVVDGIRGLQYKEHDNGQPIDAAPTSSCGSRSRGHGRSGGATDGLQPWISSSAHGPAAWHGSMHLEKADMIGDDPVASGPVGQTKGLVHAW